MKPYMSLADVAHVSQKKKKKGASLPLQQTFILHCRRTRVYTGDARLT